MRDVERAICPVDDLADPGAKGFTLGSGDRPLGVADGWMFLAEGVPLEEPADLGR